MTDMYAACQSMHLFHLAGLMQMLQTVQNAPATYCRRVLCQSPRRPPVLKCTMPSCHHAMYSFCVSCIHTSSRRVLHGFDCAPKPRQYSILHWHLQGSGALLITLIPFWFCFQHLIQNLGFAIYSISSPIKEAPHSVMLGLAKGDTNRKRKGIP